MLDSGVVGKLRYLMHWIPLRPKKLRRLLLGAGDDIIVATGDCDNCRDGIFVEEVAFTSKVGVPEVAQFPP